MINSVTLRLQVTQAGAFWHAHTEFGEDDYAPPLKINERGQVPLAYGESQDVGTPDLLGAVAAELAARQAEMERLLRDA